VVSSWSPTSRRRRGFPGTDSALFRTGRGLSDRLLALSARRRFVRRTLNLTKKRKRVIPTRARAPLYTTPHPLKRREAAPGQSHRASHPRAQEVEQKRLDRMKLWAWPRFPQNWQCSTVLSRCADPARERHVINRCFKTRYL